MKEGAIYLLDGVRYRCTSVIKTGGAWFQQINEDGTDYFEKGALIDDCGRRLCILRISEMTEYKPAGQLKLL